MGHKGEEEEEEEGEEFEVGGRCGWIWWELEHRHGHHSHEQGICLCGADAKVDGMTWHDMGWDGMEYYMEP